MDLEEVLAALDAGVSGDSLEGTQLDFKTDKPDFKSTAVDIAEAAVCLANASGGHIVLGVADKPGASGSFKGTAINASDLRSKIHELTKPPSR